MESDGPTRRAEADRGAAASVSEGSGSSDESAPEAVRGELHTLKKQVRAIQAISDSLPRRIDNRIADCIKEDEFAPRHIFTR